MTDNNHDPELLALFDDWANEHDRGKKRRNFGRIMEYLEAGVDKHGGSPHASVLDGECQDCHQVSDTDEPKVRPLPPGFEPAGWGTPSAADRYHTKSKKAHGDAVLGRQARLALPKKA